MVKSEVIYTLEDMKAFEKSSPYSKPILFFYLFLICIELYVILLHILALAGGAKLSDLWLSLFWLIAGLSICIFGIIRRKVILPKMNLNNIKKMYGENTVVYTFDEEYFNVTAQNGITSENTAIEYSKLYRVIETKDYFFLYFAKYKAYIIRKDAITYGCPEDLSILLKKHLGKKFIVRF